MEPNFRLGWQELRKTELIITVPANESPLYKKIMCVKGWLFCNDELQAHLAVNQGLTVYEIKDCWKFLNKLLIVLL